MVDQAARFDAGGDAGAASRDEDTIASLVGVHLLEHAPGDGMAEEVEEHRDVDVVVEGPRDRRSSRRASRRERETQDERAQTQENGTSGEDGLRHGRILQNLM